MHALALTDISSQRPLPGGLAFFQEAVLGEEEKLSRHEIIFILWVIVLLDASALNESI